MESREELKKAILNNKDGFLEVRSYSGKTTHRRRAVPKYDAGTNWYKGVEKLSEDQKKKTTDPFVDPEDPENELAHVELEHLKKFDMKNKIDRLIIQWLVEADNIVALTYEEGLSNPMQTFYIYNEETDISRQEYRFELKDTAIEQLRKLSDSDLTSITRLLGYRMDDSPSKIRLFLRSQIEDANKGFKFAERLLEVINDKTKDIKLFAYKAIDKGAITKTDKNQYLFGDIYLGSSEAQLISKLKDNEFQDIVIAIKEQIGESTGQSKSARGRKPTN